MDICPIQFCRSLDLPLISLYFAPNLPSYKSFKLVLSNSSPGFLKIFCSKSFFWKLCFILMVLSCFLVSLLLCFRMIFFFVVLYRVQTKLYIFCCVAFYFFLSLFQFIVLFVQPSQIVLLFIITPPFGFYLLVQFRDSGLLGLSFVRFLPCSVLYFLLCIYNCSNTPVLHLSFSFSACFLPVCLYFRRPSNTASWHNIYTSILLSKEMPVLERNQATWILAMN